VIALLSPACQLCPQKVFTEQLGEALELAIKLR
jgi:hypothetical protein